MNCNPVRSAVSLLISIFVTVALAIAQNPCGNGERRALVLSGGGIKGGFEAGAVYHLVVHRGCDFHDFAGISVGALNATFLAQAAPHYDPERSHDSLAREASALVELWESMKSQKEIVRGRPLASIRLYSPVFAADSLNDFRPLRRLLDTRISTERLDGGRPVRVGVTSFGDGTYHEIAINYPDSEIGPERFLDYVYASASLPVIGKQVRICDGNSARERSCSWYADGSLRHITPVTSYFPTRGNTSEQLPAHDSVQQLFVIVTSPYPQPGSVTGVPGKEGQSDYEMHHYAHGQHPISRRS